MRATVMYGPGDVRVENVPDAKIVETTDAVVRVTRACVCGSDLWPYNGMEPSESGVRMGHESIGVVEEVGSGVSTMNVGDLVVMPFICSDGSCVFCHEGLQPSCVNVGFFGNGGDMDGAQAEALRIPQADGTLFVLPVGEDDALMPSLLTLSDVMGTGHHAAVTAGVSAGQSVAVVGDGAVGLCGVIAAKRLGAEQIIIMGRHEDRTSLAKEFGATDIVSERGDEAVQRVRELTGRVGVPQDEAIPASLTAFFGNVKVGGGPAPSRAYIEELLPDVTEGRIEPGRVFDRTVGLDEVPEGYRTMNDREALKVMVRP